MTSEQLYLISVVATSQILRYLASYLTTFFPSYLSLAWPDSTLTERVWPCKTKATCMSACQSGSFENGWSLLQSSLISLSAWIVWSYYDRTRHLDCRCPTFTPQNAPETLSDGLKIPNFSGEHDPIVYVCCACVTQMPHPHWPLILYLTTQNFVATAVLTRSKAIGNKHWMTTFFTAAKMYPLICSNILLMSKLSHTKG